MQHLRERTVTPERPTKDPGGILYNIVSYPPVSVKPEYFPDFARRIFFMNNVENDRIRRAEAYSTKCRLRELRRERRRNKAVLTAAKVVIIAAAVLLGAVIGGGLV